jgi:opacity protein-like surface antigen
MVAYVFCTQAVLMRMSLASGLLALLVVLSVPHPLRAQSPLGGSDAWLLTPSLGVGVDEDADASLTIAGALGYPLTSTLAIEGALAHAFDLAPGDGDVDSSLTTVHGSLLLFFDTDFMLTPYVAAGLGVGKFAHDVRVPAASIDSTEVGFNAGGGIVYPLSDRAWLRGDVRVFKHIDDVPTLWRFMGGVTLRLGSN